MAFDSHGTLSFSVSGRILIVEGMGPWNREAITASEDEAVSCHKQLYGKPWGVLMILHGQPIHIHDAMDVLSEIVRKDKENGRVGTALILDKSTNPAFGSTHISQIYAKAGEICRSFSDKKEALSWLDQLIRE